MCCECEICEIGQNGSRLAARRKEKLHKCRPGKELRLTAEGPMVGAASIGNSELANFGENINVKDLMKALAISTSLRLESSPLGLRTSCFLRSYKTFSRDCEEHRFYIISAVRDGISMRPVRVVEFSDES